MSTASGDEGVALGFQILGFSRMMLYRSNFILLERSFKKQHMLLRRRYCLLHVYDFLQGFRILF